MINENEFEEVKNFLEGTFHQDIETYTEALMEYIEEVDSQWLRYIAEEIDKFLSSKISKYEKGKFIEGCTFIYFPALEVNPVEWLDSVLKEIRKAESGKK